MDEIDLQLARELNPQLGRLRVIARSRPTIERLLATPVTPLPYRKELFDALLTLHRDPGGRQLPTAFKIDHLAPLEAGDLDSAWELWNEYGRLAGVAAGGPAGPGPDKRPAER